MTIKIVLYILMTPLSIWALESINMNNFFKKNRYKQARILYILVSLVTRLGATGLRGTARNQNFYIFRKCNKKSKFLIDILYCFVVIIIGLQTETL